MKTFLYITLLAVWTATQLFAGPEGLVKERAKDLRDRNNAGQGAPTAPPNAPAPPAPTAPTAPTKTKPSPVNKIRSDIAVWQNEKAVNAESKKEFSRDVLAAVRGSRSPSSTAVDRLADKLATAVAGKTLGPTELARLAENINLAVNGASLSDDRTEEIAAQVQADLEQSGVSAATATDVADCLRELMTLLKEQL